MSKTAPIPDDVHALILDKQTELKRKHKITVKIADLIAMYVKHSVKKTEVLLGLKTDDNPESASGTSLNASDVEQVDISETEQGGTKDTRQNSICSPELRIESDVHDSNIVGEGIEAKT